MNEEMRRRMREIAKHRLTPQQEAAYYLNQYMKTINDGEMDERVQGELANYYLGLYYMVLEE